METFVKSMGQVKINKENKKFSYSAREPVEQAKIVHLST